MDAQKIRLFLLIGLFFLGFTLYGTWQQDYPTEIQHQENHAEQSVVPQAPNPSTSVDRVASESAQLVQSKPIIVETDVAKYQIDLNGGDLIRAELMAYPASEKEKDKGYLLLGEMDNRYYIAQSYLISDNQVGPDSYTGQRGQFVTQSEKYVLATGQNELTVDLILQHRSDLKFIKRYHFYAGQYLIDVEYIIENQTPNTWNGKLFYQLKRQYVGEKNGFMGVQLYQGGAYFTPDTPFNKISFDKMKKQPLNLDIQGGWVALLEHYFLSAWIPDPSKPYHFYTKVENNDIYKIGAYTEVNALPQSTARVKSRLFVGPEVTSTLKEISPGLNLTVDYGILWPISQLLFWLLKNIHEFVGNWGLAIILVTVVIKLAFYKLSASSYRSMGHMRRVQPQIQALKERYGEDKQQFSQAMMALYRKEKINPLGGCLPILLQIPVFIALYYVLLESVELRQSPFIFWITDLASKDPFYILPLLMGATMFIQQKLSPAPPDPMQAKMMMLMPIVFTFLFMSFPSGLVLYWTVNNLLSILQQWHITRSLEKEGLKRA